MAIKGYWRLNGNSNDASGNGNNGTDVNVTYKNGYATYNSSAYSNIGSNGFPFGNSPRTTIVRARRTTNDAYGYSLLFGYGIEGPTNGRNWEMGCGSSGVSFSSFGCSINTPFSLELNRWYSIALTFNGTIVNDIKLFIDGVQVSGIYNNGTTIINTVSSLQPVIGHHTGKWEAIKFVGDIDQVIIDNTAWSAAKVKNEYARTKGFF